MILIIMVVIVLMGLFLTSCRLGGDVLLIGAKDIENKLFEGVVVDNLEEINEALSDGANINNFSGRLPIDSNPLWMAFKHSPSKRVPEYLINRGADVNIPNQDGVSLLGWLAQNCDIHFCELLIKYGAKVDYIEKTGNTPLEDVLNYGTRATCTEKNVDTIITMLFENGAKIRPESLIATLKGVFPRESKMNYLVKKRIIEGLLSQGYKSGLDPILEASFLGKSNDLIELIKAGKMQRDDGVHILNYIEIPSKIPKSETNETTYREHILYSTASFGSVKAMKLLKEKGFDIEHKDKSSFTPLIVASYYGNIEMVKYLINEGANKEKRTTDAGSDKTALYYAVENNQYDVAKYLIKMGADIKPYKLFAGSVDVFNAAWENGNAKMMKLILDNGYKSDKSIEDCLFINALKSSDPNELKKYMGYKYKGFDYTAALSIYGGKLETLKFLVEGGAKVNGVDGDGLMLSASSYDGKTDIVDYLIRNGANINAAIVGTDADGDLKGKRIDSAFNNAVIRGNLNIIKLLVENGADIEQELNGNETPLLAAAGCGSKHILEYLLKKGAKVNHQNSKGESALMRAAHLGRIDNVKLLIEFNADKNLKDKNGHTALDLAKEKNKNDVVDYLEKQK